MGLRLLVSRACVDAVWAVGTVISSSWCSPVVVDASRPRQLGVSILIVGDRVPLPAGCGFM